MVVFGAVPIPFAAGPPPPPKKTTGVLREFVLLTHECILVRRLRYREDNYSLWCVAGALIFTKILESGYPWFVCPIHEVRSKQSSLIVVVPC